jgi:hypothetical protein
VIGNLTSSAQVVPLQERLMGEGRAHEIEQIYAAELSIKEKAFGADHISTLHFVHNLAQV